MSATATGRVKGDLLSPQAEKAIITERAHQEIKVPDRQHSVGEWLLIMEGCLDKAKQIWQAAGPDADVNTLHEIRQVTASGVACMNQRGAPLRELPEPV